MRGPEDRCRRVTVTFMPSGRRITVCEGENLLRAAHLAGVHVNASCGGAGVCGKCKVVVDRGNVRGGRGSTLTEQELSQGVRQACLSEVVSDLTVTVPTQADLSAGVVDTAIPIRHRARQKTFEIEQLKEEGIFAAPVEKFNLELSPPSVHNNMADAGRLLQGLADQYGERNTMVELSVLRKLRRVLRAGRFRVTVTLSRPVHSRYHSRIINVQAGAWAHRNFALAVDIGTTTVHGQLLDLHTGRVLAEAGRYNAQMSYGEDVISRIIHAEKPGGLERMQELAVGTVNEIIAALLGRSGVAKGEINSVTLAGNTTMTHLFLGLEPHNIRRAPYVPVTTFFPPIRAAMDVGLDLPHHAVALFFPSVSSYVGGDIVAGIMGAGMYRTEKKTLFIDVGTNAEIVIGNREWLACAACSAGPAFEGGGITHGMRAAEGAIEDFSIDPHTLEPMNFTIGSARPIGICGSGLLIIVARLFESGVIDRRGRFRRDLSSPRVRRGEHGWEYVLAWKEESGNGVDIAINEADIDNFMRAKAAIHAGIVTLVESVGLTTGDLDEIILAGAFGSYIDLDSAMTVGLLPETDPARISYIGNGSLMGCRMSAVSNHIRQDVVEVVKKMTSFELSEVDSFKDNYIASLFLPHTDLSLFPRASRRIETAAARMNHDPSPVQG